MAFKFAMQRIGNVILTKILEFEERGHFSKGGNSLKLTYSISDINYCIVTEKYKPASYDVQSTPVCANKFDSNEEAFLVEKKIIESFEKIFSERSKNNRSKENEFPRLAFRTVYKGYKKILLVGKANSLKYIYLPINTEQDKDVLKGKDIGFSLADLCIIGISDITEIDSINTLLTNEKFEGMNVYQLN